VKQDILIDIFKKHLDQIDPDRQGLEDLVYEVVGDYMAHLLNEGHIPQHMMDTVEVDLREEVLEIYRKVTYGFMNLQSYLQARDAKNNNNARSRARTTRDS